MTEGPEPTKQAPPQPLPPAVLAALSAAFEAHSRGDLVSAERGYRGILVDDPGNFHALQLLGVLAGQTMRTAEAEGLLRHALAVDPGSSLVNANLALILQQRGQLEEALAFAGAALAADPANPDALHHRIEILQGLRRHEDALATADSLAAIAPNYPYASGLRLQLKREACAWDHLDEETEAVIDSVRAGKRAVTPFFFLALSDSLADQKRCAELFAGDRARPATALRPTPAGDHDRLRIAYLSADFHDHPTAYLAAELFERHDRSRFEVTAISFDRRQEGPMRARLERAFDRFVDVTERSDADAARLIAELEIDIAIDLKGFTKDSRPGILAQRPAPIQAAYLGYPGTMGAAYVDYLIADAVVVRPEDHDHYAEKIVVLPGSYQVNDSARPGPGVSRSRAGLGLPEDAFVFACFASAYKLTPEIFGIWMRLLAAVEGSVLWLLATNPTAIANLRKEATARGIPAGRLVFAPPADQATHLARHAAADLFLDTLPYGSHTGASDALWAGVPILTCYGRAFAGRVAASLLTAIGLREMIAYSLAEYETLALELARDRTRLALLRQRLAHGRQGSPLFDAKGFCRNFETALTMMWARKTSGQPPASFSVPATG